VTRPAHRRGACPTCQQRHCQDYNEPVRPAPAENAENAETAENADAQKTQKTQTRVGGNSKYSDEPIGGGVDIGIDKTKHFRPRYRPRPRSNNRLILRMAVVGGWWLVGGVD
jgi:hypothetical protein